MDFAKFISHLKSTPTYRDQIVYEKTIPAREAQYAEIRNSVNPAILQALKANGIDKFYTHQARAIDAILEGKGVVVVTGTASGKTLCYQVPVLHSILNNPKTRAFFVFPTKALAQDQLRKLEEFCLPKKIVSATYDGDTPLEERRAIRKYANIVLTNPDMLHIGILPNHTAGWSEFFRNLKFVVLDEIHAYRGIFGSHTANVFRRMRRICQHYGSEPVFICSSATIANPKELVRNLIGLDVEVIAEDGSPRGPKRFLFWNPPFLDAERATRRSTNSEVTFLFTELVKAGISTITFTKARVTTELILRYASFALRETDPDLVLKIASYRAGYLPQERRAIEQGIFEGELLGVVATTALELGIDIGGLDAAILNGYPGTIASAWQQAGRAGRGTEESLAILVALDGPIDQYLMRHPDYFFGRSHEHAIVNPENPYILAAHLLCSAHEIPISESDQEYFGDSTLEVLKLLESSGLLAHREKWYWLDTNSPAANINIRSASGDNYQILDITNRNQLVGTVDSARAFWTVHPGAVYLHQGDTYIVEKLDVQTKTAFVRPAENLDYYTQTRELEDIKVVKTRTQKDLGMTQAYFGEVKVTNQVIGYAKKQLFTESVLSVEPLDLPPQTFQTQALWFEIPDEIVERLKEDTLDMPGGIHAVEHGAIGIMPLFSMCDRWDIGGVSHPHHPDTEKPTIFIYDAYAGGVGIAEKAFELLEELLAATLKAIQECPCQEGCPSCIQSPKCGNNNEPLDKKAAIKILRNLLCYTE